MAGPMTVLYKFHHKGIKVVVCRYLDTYTYFFALGGEVYIDFVLPPDKYQLKQHKTTLNAIEPQLISHLCAKAQENIEYQLKNKGRWYNPFIKIFNDTATRWLNELKSKLFNAISDRGTQQIPSRGSEGLGSEQSNAAGHTSKASGVRS